MKNLEKTLREILFTLHKNFNRYRIKLTDGYELSVVTGSHFNSTKLGTVEVALIKDEEFVYGPIHSDKSIIHYMDWETFNQFIKHIKTAYEEELSKYYLVIFDTYKKEAN